MNSTLAADTQTEPSPEEIARMQAEMEEMWIEIEACNAQMEANRPEIDRLRMETRVILDSIQRMMSQ